jgi:type I restriction enzyme, S subunit
MDRRQLKFNFEDLPEGWKVTNLGKFCEFYNGKAHEKCIDENGEFIVVNSKFISSDGKITKRTKENLFPLYKNDIVMVMSDVPKGKALAKCYIIEDHNKYSLNQRICAIRSDKFDIEFLYYHLNRHPYLLSFDNGGNQTNLRKDDILNCPLFFPSLDEQKRIVAILDEAFEGIDQAIRNTEKNLANARELFDSYLNKIFTQKGDTWEKKKLEDVCIQITDGKHGDCNNEENSGYFFLSAKDIKQDKLNYENARQITKEDFNETHKRTKLEPSDILITNSGTIGRTAIVPEDDRTYKTTFQKSVAILKPIKEQINSEFCRYSLMAHLDHMVNISAGTAQKNLLLRDLRAHQFYMPDTVDEQKIIATKLDDFSGETQRLETIYRKKIAALNELKQSILQKAFTGQLTQKSL